MLVVPVHTGSGMVSLRCGRLPSGERVAIAFTTQASLHRVMGTGQPWIHISAEAMRDMLAPLGVTRNCLAPTATSGRRSPAWMATRPRPAAWWPSSPGHGVQLQPLHQAAGHRRRRRPGPATDPPRDGRGHAAPRRRLTVTSSRRPGPVVPGYGACTESVILRRRLERPFSSSNAYPRGQGRTAGTAYSADIATQTIRPSRLSRL